MTKKELTKKEIMEQTLQERKISIDQDNAFYKRITETENKIAGLENEAKSLKESRPALLADCKDVSKINKRLKDIDEEIEICRDTIIGVTEKQKNFKRDLYEAKMSAVNSFRNYIDEIIESLKPEYMKTAKKFASILNEYITLENIRAGSDYVNSYFDTSSIKLIPNVEDKEHPIFKYSAYNIWKENKDIVCKKYNIPDFNIEQISYHETF